MTFIATLIKRRFDEETPAPPRLRETFAYSALPGVGRARHMLDDGGASGFAQWLASSTRLLIADASLERLQTPLLTSPVRTAELCELAAGIVRLAPEINVLEVMSPQAFGDAINEARECPFRRIEEIRRVAPGLVLRASLSAASALGENVAPRSAFASTADELVDAGIDIIRIGDPYNDTTRLTAAVTAATLSDSIVEGIVSINSSLQPSSAQLHIEQAIETAKALEQSGVNTIVLEDRCGVMRPVGAYTLVRAVRREVNLPIWVRVAEVTGYGLATLIAAVEAGAVGVDALFPSLTGLGVEPSNIALTTALNDTERKPDVDPLNLATLDDLFARTCRLLGGWNPVRRTPPDIADVGVTPQIIESVLAHSGGLELLSRDQVLAACEAARRVFGDPSMIDPAPTAVARLATQMLKGGSPAGTLIDKARADDPEGVLDSMGSLREGGFPESTIETRSPKNREELITLLWGDDGRRYFDHQGRFGHLEMIPSFPLRYGLGVGDSFSALVHGEPHHVEVLGVDLDAARAQVSLNGEAMEIPFETAFAHK